MSDHTPRGCGPWYWRSWHVWCHHDMKVLAAWGGQKPFLGLFNIGHCGLDWGDPVYHPSGSFAQLNPAILCTWQQRPSLPTLQVPWEALIFWALAWPIGAVLWPRESMAAVPPTSKVLGGPHPSPETSASGWGHSVPHSLAYLMLNNRKFYWYIGIVYTELTWIRSRIQASYWSSNNVTHS